ncbi:MAG: hypothetical protein ACI4PF_03475 [Christensenellales bacterium]
MKNNTKKILAGACLGLVGMGCLVGCDAKELKIPTDYNVNTTIPTDYNVTTTINQEKQYRLTVINDSEHGTIYPDLNNETRSVMVDEGDSYTFTIRPKEGYKVDNLLIDGELVEAQEIYTFEDVDGDHSIGAVYSQIEVDSRFNIKSLTLKGMSFTVRSIETISVGDKIYFNIDNAIGHEFEDREIMPETLCEVVRVSQLNDLKTIYVEFKDLPSIEFTKNGWLGFKIYSKDKLIVYDTFAREDLYESFYGDCYYLNDAESHNFWLKTETGDLQLIYSNGSTHIDLCFEAIYFE